MGLGLGLGLLSVACGDANDRPDGEVDDSVGIPNVPDPVDPPEADPGDYLKGIEAEFQAAATEFDVPPEVLKAVGYVESQWQMVAGEVEFDGLDPAFGTMALRGGNLGRGAALLGVAEDEVKSTRLTNIRAAAAVLREKADLGKIDRKDIGAWAPAIVELSGITDKSAAAVSYIHQNVYALIINGLVVTDLDGNVVAEIEPRIVIPNYPGADGQPVLAANPDYNGATWRTTQNFSQRPAGSTGVPQIVVIHTCEGAYAGCWGWLTKKEAGVSAHYVVKEDGSEITQLVKEADKAWHIAAKYKSSLNGGKFAELEGTSGNNFTIGIEHAGYGKQATWNGNLIQQSANLVCDITRRNNIPRDKFHIVGHGQLQPYNRSDPGPNWPWATYFEKINAACSDDAPMDEPPPPPPNDPQPNDSSDTSSTTDATTGEPPPDPDPSGDPPPPAPKADPAEIIVDSFNGNNALIADFYAPASWTSTASTPGYYGSNYLYATTTTMDDGAEFWFYLNNAGKYDVDVWFTAGGNRSAETPVVAFDAAGNELGFLGVNMQAGGKAWISAGSYNFTAGWNKVMISRWAPGGFVVIADAVRLSSG